MKILQIRSGFEDCGPATQSLTIAKELRHLGHEVEFAGSGGEYVDTIKENNFVFHQLSSLSRTARHPINIVRSIYQIKKLLTEHEYEVIHGHNAAVVLVAFIAIKLTGRKVSLCHSVRGVELRPAFFWRNWIYKAYPAKLLAVCEFTKQKLVSLGANADNIFVTYNGVDTKKFSLEHVNRGEIRKEFNIPSDAIIIGHVGSMSHYAKGQGVLIKAFARLYDSCPNVYLLFVGGGKYLEQFSKEAEELGVSDRTIFAGMRFDTPVFQADFDIFCLPSIWGEMFPNAILEAMAMANPWVGSDISGLSELTADGKAGWVLTPGDDAALAEKLKLLVDDKELREERGKAGYEEVQEKFTISKVVENYLKYYLS